MSPIYPSLVYNPWRPQGKLQISGRTHHDRARRAGGTPGVMVLFWSPASAPAGRIPGTTRAHGAYLMGAGARLRRMAGDEVSHSIGITGLSEVLIVVGRQNGYTEERKSSSARGKFRGLGASQARLGFPSPLEIERNDELFSGGGVSCGAVAGRFIPNGGNYRCQMSCARCPQPIPAKVPCSGLAGVSLRYEAWPWRPQIPSTNQIESFRFRL
jgi:hypothetical protein